MIYLTVGFYYLQDFIYNNCAIYREGPFYKITEIVTITNADSSGSLSKYGLFEV